MSIGINETLNINVTHGVPTPINPTSPDTGFVGNVGDVVSGTGSTACALIITVALLLIIGTVIFCLRRRLHRTACTAVSIFAFALAFGLTLPAIHFVSQAVDAGFGAKARPHETNFNVEISDDKTTTAVTQPQDFVVGDDAPYGYTVTAYVEDDPALYSSSGNKIDSINTDFAAPEFFPDNTYGVKSFMTESYTPLSADSSMPTTIIDTDEPATADTLIPITYATKLVQGTSTEVYTGQITYTLNIKPAPTLEELEAEGATMQDERIHAAIANTPIDGRQYRLKDARDNKVYYVAKLADGNVWMTQNLDLGENVDLTLTSDDTDLNTISAFTLPASQEPWESFAVYDDSRVADPGNKYLPYGWRTPAQDVTCSTDTHDGESCHYHQGNYYNWYAATAGMNAETISSEQNAPNSICPKGWQLPISGPNQTGSKSFAYLVEQQGLDANNIQDPPAYFVFSGYYGPTSAVVGQAGMFWSSTAVGKWSSAYQLYFNYDAVRATEEFDFAYIGYSIRCIAR